MLCWIDDCNIQKPPVVFISSWPAGQDKRSQWWILLSPFIAYSNDHRLLLAWRWNVRWNVFFFVVQGLKHTLKHSYDPYKSINRAVRAMDRWMYSCIPFFFYHDIIRSLHSENKTETETVNINTNISGCAENSRMIVDCGQWCKVWTLESARKDVGDGSMKCESFISTSLYTCVPYFQKVHCV